MIYTGLKDGNEPRVLDGHLFIWECKTINQKCEIPFKPVVHRVSCCYSFIFCSSFPCKLIYLKFSLKLSHTYPYPHIQANNVTPPCIAFWSQSAAAQMKCAPCFFPRVITGSKNKRTLGCSDFSSFEKMIIWHVGFWVSCISESRGFSLCSPAQVSYRGRKNDFKGFRATKSFMLYSNKLFILITLSSHLCKICIKIKNHKSLGLSL